MRLHNEIPNMKCIGKEVCASIDEDIVHDAYPIFTLDNQNYDRGAVYIDSHCAYMDGEICEIRGYDELNKTVTMYCEDGDAHSIGEYDGVFTISYDRYMANFGTEWRT